MTDMRLIIKINVDILNQKLYFGWYMIGRGLLSQIPSQNCFLRRKTLFMRYFDKVLFEPMFHFLLLKVWYHLMDFQSCTAFAHVKSRAWSTNCSIFIPLRMDRNGTGLFTIANLIIVIVCCLHSIVSVLYQLNTKML